MKKFIITTGVIAVAGGLVTAAAVSSCDTTCEVEAKPSVIVQVVDQETAAGTTARVSAQEVWYEWTNEDGEVVKEAAECVDEGCTEWVLGNGQPGVYAFHATVCGQVFESEVTLDFNDEGCEVDTRIVDLSVSTSACPTDIQAPEPPTSGPPPSVPPWLAPSDPACTLEARFSVVGALWGEVEGRMVPIEADRVYFIHQPTSAEGGEDEGGKGKGHEIGKGKGHEIGKGKGHGEHDEDGAGPEETPAICLDEGCTRFAAGVETMGRFTVGAEACGQVVEATATVGRTEDGCHVDTQSVVLQFDASKCRDTPTIQANPEQPECPSTTHTPSAVIMPVVQEGDMLRPQPTSTLMFAVAGREVDGRKAQGFCAVEAANDLCEVWIAGWGRTGDFVAYTEACGIETAVSYSVPMAEDGCGPDTLWLPVSVDTRGCIQAPSTEGNPPPVTPAAGTDIAAPKPSPGSPAAGTDVIPD